MPLQSSKNHLIALNIETTVNSVQQILLLFRMPTFTHVRRSGEVLDNNFSKNKGEFPTEIC